MKPCLPLLTLLLTAVGTLLNPFLLVYLPYALQESALMFFCLPLLFIWVGAKNMALPKRAALVLVMALVAYIIRSSLVWWLLPAVLYAGWLLWSQRRQFRRWLPSMATVVLPGCLVVGTQVYISKQKSALFNPDSSVDR